MFFSQEYYSLFPVPNKNVIFNIHYLLFQANSFSGQLLKIDGYN